MSAWGHVWSFRIAARSLASIPELNYSLNSYYPPFITPVVSPHVNSHISPFKEFRPQPKVTYQFCESMSETQCLQAHLDLCRLSPEKQPLFFSFFIKHSHMLVEGKLMLGCSLLLRRSDRKADISSAFWESLFTGSKPREHLRYLHPPSGATCRGPLNCSHPRNLRGYCFGLGKFTRNTKIGF